MNNQTHPAVSIEDIRTAATRIAPYIVRTPLVESPRLNDWLGFRVLVKAECLQCRHSAFTSNRKPSQSFSRGDSTSGVRTI